MAPIDIVILALVIAAVAAVLIRTKRKGPCADCAQGGACSGNCSHAKKGECAAVAGVDAIAEKLGRGVE